MPLITGSPASLTASAGNKSHGFEETRTPLVRTMCSTNTTDSRATARERVDANSEWVETINDMIQARREELERMRDNREDLTQRLLERMNRSPGVQGTPGDGRQRHRTPLSYRGGGGGLLVDTPDAADSSILRHQNQQLLTSVASSGTRKRQQDLSGESFMGQTTGHSSGNHRAGVFRLASPPPARTLFGDNMRVDEVEKKDQLEADVEQLRAKLERTQGEYRERERETEQLRALAGDADRRLDLMRDEVNKKEEQRRRIEETLDRVLQEGEGLRILNTELQGRVQELESHLNDRKRGRAEEVEALTSEKDHFKRRLSEFEAAIQAERESKRMVETDLLAKITALETLRHGMERMEEKFVVERQELQGSIADLHGRLATETTLLQESRMELEQLKVSTAQECDYLKCQVMDRDESLQSLRHELDSQQHRIEGLEAQLTLSTQQHPQSQHPEHHHGSSTALQQRQQQLLLELRSREEALTSLEAQLQVAEREKAEAVATTEMRLQQEVRYKDQAIAALEAELQTALRDQERTAADLGARLQEELRYKHEALSSLEAQLREAKETLAVVEEQAAAERARQADAGGGGSVTEAVGLLENLRAEAQYLPIAVDQEREAREQEVMGYRSRIAELEKHIWAVSEQNELRCEALNRQIEAMEGTLREKEALLIEKDTLLAEQEERGTMTDVVIKKLKEYACCVFVRSHRSLRRQVLRRGFSGLWRSRLSYLERVKHELSRSVAELERQLAEGAELSRRQAQQVEQLTNELGDERRRRTDPVPLVPATAAPTSPPPVLSKREVIRPTKSSHRRASSAWMTLLSLLACIFSYHYAISVGRGTFCSLDNERLTG